MKRSLVSLIIEVSMLHPNLVRADVNGLSASPASLSITSTTVTTATASTTVSWSMSGGATAKTWYMTVESSHRIR